MNAAFEMKGMLKERGDFRLGPIDLTIEQGLMVALVGPNGSGKSTLFRTILGLLHPEQGEVRVFGRGPDPATEVDVKQRIGYVGDSLSPYDENMTIQQWKAFISRWYPSWNEEAWERICERLEIEAKKSLKSLSTGQYKRLAFALAIAHEPELLLLDEPSSGLDPFVWRIMMDEIKAFLATGDRTVFIATHVMEEVRRFADMIVFLHKGEIVGVYEKDRLLDDWKTMWVQGSAGVIAGIPGAESAEEGRDGLTRFVTSDARSAERLLRERGIGIVETRAVELEDILWQLMEMEKRTNGSGT
ncbi:ABC transporter ATP-binding protein [Paenibacillus sp. TRM 82003]|nr:ABC transporter ATP-binding protein [Paenibacillus sp. TRM 82003]